MEIKFKCCIFSSWGYWYFSLQSWFQLVLHPACHFTWYTLHINYIAGKKNYTAGLKYTPLTYSVPKFEPVCCSISGSNCCFLTCIQISKEAGKMVWYSHLLKTFPQFVVIHTVKDFGIVNKVAVDVFLELSCFFYDPTDVGNFISDSSAFSKSILSIWKFLVHVLLKTVLENFKHYFASIWDEWKCMVVWTFFSIAFLWGWNKKWPFPVLWPLMCFPTLLAYWMQHFYSIIF